MSHPRHTPPSRARAARGLALLAAPALACLLASPLRAQDAPQPAQSPASAVLIQQSNGFPGGEKTSAQLARQEVWIEGSRLRILDRDNAYGMFIDLDTQQVIETDFLRKIYHLRPFSYYEKYRRDREQALAAQRREFEQGLATRSGDELKAWREEYRQIGGDPDHPGRLTATLDHYPQDRKQVELLVDRQPRQVTLEHYTIRENQAKQPIFDVWVTTEVELQADLVRFYRALGTFSKPVTDQLLALKGAVVICDAKLDAGSFHRMFHTQILEVRNGGSAGSSRFVVADMAKAGWLTEAEWKQKQQEARKDEPKPACANCGQPIEGTPTQFRSPWGGQIYLLDGEECRKALIKKLIAERKKR